MKKYGYLSMFTALLLVGFEVSCSQPITGDEIFGLAGASALPAKSTVLAMKPTDFNSYNAGQAYVALSLFSQLGLVSTVWNKKHTGAIGFTLVKGSGFNPTSFSILNAKAAPIFNHNKTL